MMYNWLKAYKLYNYEKGNLFIWSNTSQKD
jgi:hypothetical protein